MNRVSRAFWRRRLARSAEKLEEAARKGLVEASGQEVVLTPKGRGKLKVVMIGGAFEIIHPGHLHTMDEAKSSGTPWSSWWPRTGRSSRTRDATRSRPRNGGSSSSLRSETSTRRIPGGQGSIYDTLEKVRPDVVALGYDQKHNPQDIENEAAKRGMKVRVVRLNSPLPGIKTSKIVSTSGR